MRVDGTCKICDFGLASWVSRKHAKARPRLRSTSDELLEKAAATKSKAAKYCASCGKPTVKAARRSCKHCGSTAWTRVTQRGAKKKAVRKPVIARKPVAGEAASTGARQGGYVNQGFGTKSFMAPEQFSAPIGTLIPQPLKMDVWACRDGRGVRCCGANGGAPRLRCCGR